VRAYALLLLALPLLLVSAALLWLRQEASSRAPAPKPVWQRPLPPGREVQEAAAPGSPAPAEQDRAPAAGVHRSAAPARDARPQMWLHPGDRLRMEPHVGAKVVAESNVYANVGIVRRRGEWRLVCWGASLGWVPAREEPARQPEPEPVLPVPARPPDDARLAAARRLLAGGGREERVGPYPLYTDVVDPGLLLLLDRAAAGLEDAYRQRYGLRPLPGAAEAVVLFAREEDYRRYLRGEGGSPASTGHASHGVVTLWRHGRLAEVVRGTLVHELVHLLNRRAIGPALPPWLDEGLATDLGESAYGEGGRLLPGTLAEVALRTPARVEWHLGAASRELLREADAAGTLPPLASLTAGADGFGAVEPRALAYAESAFLVRSLLAGRHAARFRAFLAAVATGGDPSGETLRDELGVSWEELERDLRASLLAPAAGLASSRRLRSPQRMRAGGVLSR
jgi:hypothetical protein